MTKHLHHVHHKHVAGEGVESWITCDGDRSSACHIYPEPDPLDPRRWGEDYTEADCIEYGVPHDECVHVTNAEVWGCAMLCGPDGERVHDGPIIPSWNGDCMVWEYAEEAPVRDPKAHAKVLALRRRDVVQALTVAARREDSHRTLRLSRLLTLLNRVVGRHNQETRWFYDHTTRMWAHTEIDTEEDA